MWRATLNELPPIRFSNGQNNFRCESVFSRHVAPELWVYLPPPRGRGECRVPAAPAASCALCIGKKHTSNNEYTGTPGIPARNGFNGLCRALPGDRALLPPSSRGYLACPHPVGPTCLPQNLTPASGRQDHTILPSAATSLVRTLFDRSRIQRTRPAIPSRAKRCRVHRIPCPTSVTIAKRPSVWDGMTRLIEMFLPTTEAKYFCKEGWTALSTNRPTGKSPHGGESKFRSCPGRGAARRMG